jgi:hypothetical protein
MQTFFVASLAQCLLVQIHQLRDQATLANIHIDNLGIHPADLRDQISTHVV